jgi:hypothetical protein
MFKLIKFSLFLAVIIGGVYFLLGVSFGKKTLGEHLSGISETEEAETLKSEVGKKIDGAAGELKRKASNLALEELDKKVQVEKAAVNGRPEEALSKLSESERESLKTLIKEKQGAAAAEMDRKALNQLIHKKNADQR